MGSESPRDGGRDLSQSGFHLWSSPLRQAAFAFPIPNFDILV